MRNNFKVTERAKDHLKIKWGEKTYILRFKGCTRTKEEISQMNN